MNNTILITDDSLTVRMDLAEAFQEAGFKTILCATLGEARQALSSEEISLAILDIHLPDGDGTQLLAEIRNSGRFPDLPVVMLSSEADVGEGLQQTNANVTAFVGKPYDRASLISRVKALLGNDVSDSSKADAPPTVESAASSFGPTRVLAVDDSPTYLHELEYVLREEGYEVVLAHSGSEALELLAVQQVDCVLLDLMMPGLSGHDTCRRIKANPATRDIPLIMLTALDDQEAILEGLEMGADDYIAKSGDFRVLRARVRTQLRRRQLEVEHRSIQKRLLSAELEAAEARTARTIAARDVLEQRRREEALQETNVELESAKSIAEKASLAKSEFLSSMSHELRTPLNAILGFAQLMESDSPPPTPAQTESISQILDAGWHLMNLINEILDLSAIESGKLSLSLEPVSLGEVLSTCQAMMEPQAQKRGIRMTFPIFEDPKFVVADRTRLKQILINLLSNAIKYNKKCGSVVVDAVICTPGIIRVTITDTGAGLRPEKIAQLFQPFNRLGQETGVEEGTGIGLVVTKRLVELSGGAIGVDSTVGVGSEFWIELRSASTPKLGDVESIPMGRVDKQVLAGETQHALLYVDDNPTNLYLVEQILARRPDIRLSTALTAPLGIQLARDTQPDAILMDINLPGISGLQALKILREDPSTAHIPVVALSANAMPRDIATSMDAGFFSYLTKPIKIDEFIKILDEALAFAKMPCSNPKS